MLWSLECRLANRTLVRPAVEHPEPRLGDAPVVRLQVQPINPQRARESGRIPDVFRDHHQIHLPNYTLRGRADDLVEVRAIVEAGRAAPCGWPTQPETESVGEVEREYALLRTRRPAQQFHAIVHGACVSFAVPGARWPQHSQRAPGIAGEQ